MGRISPYKKRKVFSVVSEQSLYDTIDRYATKKVLSISDVVVKAVTRFLKSELKTVKK